MKYQHVKNDAKDETSKDFSAVKRSKTDHGV
jgi:hypothetical protein